MIRHTGRHTSIETSRDEREGTSLTTALYKDILTVPVGQRTEIVRLDHSSDNRSHNRRLW